MKPNKDEDPNTFGTALEFRGVQQGVYDHLKLQIIVGNLSPGQKLNEAELATRFKTSRAPLREAFRKLESDNLVISIPRKGCFVSELSLEDCIEICQAREMIECFAVDLLERNGIIDLSGVAATFEVLDDLSLPSSNDPHERVQYLKAILDFHTKLVEATGNFRICQSYQGIFTTLARYRSTYIPTAQLAFRSRKEHKLILDLISSRHYGQAKEALRSHLDWALEEITAGINTMSSESEAV